MRSRNFGGRGGRGKGDLEKSRFDWFFFNDGIPKVKMWVNLISSNNFPPHINNNN